MLVEEAPDYLWGRHLGAGSYASITIDEAVAECVVGGTGERAPRVQLRYTARIVTITGVRAEGSSAPAHA